MKNMTSFHSFGLALLARSHGFLKAKLHQIDPRSCRATSRIMTWPLWQTKVFCSGFRRLVVTVTGPGTVPKIMTQTHTKRHENYLLNACQGEHHNCQTKTFQRPHINMCVYRVIIKSCQRKNSRQFSPLFELHWGGFCFKKCFLPTNNVTEIASRFQSL